MITTDPEAGPVDRSSLVKGFAVEKDRYIRLTEDGIWAVKLESTKTIDIEQFIPKDESTVSIGIIPVTWPQTANSPKRRSA